MRKWSTKFRTYINQLMLIKNKVVLTFAHSESWRRYSSLKTHKDLPETGFLKNADSIHV
jgi:hypothetical protein